jgi:transposase InsO family protein
VLRWHRDLIARHHATASRPTRRGRPRTIRSIRALVLRLARENSSWGYRRIHGELQTLGIRVAPSTVWEILHEEGIDPAPERTATSWADFLRTQAHAILAADFLETVTLTGTRLYILAVIEHTTRRIRILGATAHPTAAWVTQTARNLAMDLQDAGSTARYLIRDRDGKYPALFDTILADTGITIVRSGVHIPRMNAIMERWVRSCRRELLDRTLIYNQRHLLHALRAYEMFYNTHRPTRASPTPDHSTRCPNQSPTRSGSPTSTSTDTTGSAASCTNMIMPPDLPGDCFKIGSVAHPVVTQGHPDIDDESMSELVQPATGVEDHPMVYPDLRLMYPGAAATSWLTHRHHRK